MLVVQAGIERWTDGEFLRGDIVFAHGISRTTGNSIGKQWGPSRVRDVSWGGFLLSKLTHLYCVRNFSFITNGYRMTTWEGRWIPIRASCARKLMLGTLPESQPTRSADQTNVLGVGTDITGNKEVAPG